MSKREGKHLLDGTAIAFQHTLGLQQCFLMSLAAKGSASTRSKSGAGASLKIFPLVFRRVYST